jgi:hypothetical protein
MRVRMSSFAATPLLRPAPRRAGALVLFACALSSACGGTPAVDPGGAERAAPNQSAASGRAENRHAVLARSTVMLRFLVEFYTGADVSSAEGSGSGFVIDLEGRRVVATAAHVIDGATEIMALHPSGARLPVTTVLAVDVDSDLALLEVDGLPEEARAVPLSDAKPELGDEVVLISSPLGLDTTLSFGTVSAFRPEQKAFQLAAGVSPGSSGGLAADADGRVLGVIRSKARAEVGGENITWITPARYLTELYHDLDPTPLAKAPDPTRMALRRTEHVRTSNESPFEERRAAAKIQIQSGPGSREHYCAEASDPNATVALAEAAAPVDDAFWRVARGRSCATFGPDTLISIWVGNDDPRSELEIKVEHQK